MTDGEEEFRKRSALCYQAPITSIVEHHQERDQLQEDGARALADRGLEAGDDGV